MYGRENRLKVARDEEAYNEEQKKIKEKHQIAEREHRHKLLLSKARQRHGGSATIRLDDGPEASLETALEPDTSTQIDDRIIHNDKTGALYLDNSQIGQRPSGVVDVSVNHSSQKKSENDKRPHAISLDSRVAADPQLPGAPSLGDGNNDLNQQQVGVQHHRLEHINLFAEEEAQAKNPERQREQRQAALARGDPITQTSDAAFDAQFGFAHGLKPSQVPWYARSHTPVVELKSVSKDGRAEHPPKRMQTALAAAATTAHGGLAMPPKTIGSNKHSDNIIGAAALDEWRRRGHQALIGQGDPSLPPTAEQEDGGIHGTVSDEGNHRSEDGKKRRRREDRRRMKEKRKREKKDKKTSTNSEKKDTQSVWNAMREERLRREAVEKIRQTEAVRAAQGMPWLPPGGKRKYHSAYGFGS